MPTPLRLASIVAQGRPGTAKRGLWRKGAAIASDSGLWEKGFMPLLPLLGLLLAAAQPAPQSDAAITVEASRITPEQARRHHATLVTQVVRMLCAGIIHGDLSEFNVLLGVHEGEPGPVIIDLPQAVDAAGNNHAQRMLMRDVANLRDFFGQFAPELLATQYGPEMWSLYQSGLLSNETPLTGHYERAHADVDMQAVLREIDDARAEDAARRLRMAAA